MKECMKECMYTHHYYSKRAVVSRGRTAHKVFFFILGIAALYSVYCLTTLVRT